MSTCAPALFCSSSGGWSTKKLLGWASAGLRRMRKGVVGGNEDESLLGSAGLVRIGIWLSDETPPR